MNFRNKFTDILDSCITERPIRAEDRQARQLEEIAGLRRAGEHAEPARTLQVLLEASFRCEFAEDRDSSFALLNDNREKTPTPSTSRNTL